MRGLIYILAASIAFMVSVPAPADAACACGAAGVHHPVRSVLKRVGARLRHPFHRAS